MREQLEQRVSELRAEQQKGQQMLAELEAKQAELQQTLLRISGAIQVLEELLASPAVGASPADGADAPQRDGLVSAARRSQGVDGPSLPL
jgi:chromosome segregation ATPase